MRRLTRHLPRLASASCLLLCGVAWFDTAWSLYGLADEIGQSLHGTGSSAGCFAPILALVAIFALAATLMARLLAVFAAGVGLVFVGSAGAQPRRPSLLGVILPVVGLLAATGGGTLVAIELDENESEPIVLWIVKMAVLHLVAFFTGWLARASEPDRAEPERAAPG